MGRNVIIGLKSLFTCLEGSVLGVQFTLLSLIASYCGEKSLCVYCVAKGF